MGAESGALEVWRSAHSALRPAPRALRQRFASSTYGMGEGEDIDEPRSEPYPGNINDLPERRIRRPQHKLHSQSLT